MNTKILLLIPIIYGVTSVILIGMIVRAVQDGDECFPIRLSSIFAFIFGSFSIVMFCLMA